MKFENKNNNLLNIIKSYNQDINPIKEELEKTQEINNQDEYGWTPLFYIITHTENKELISLAIQKGADVNHKDLKRITPLHLAVQINNKQVLTLLLENGAKSESNEFYKTPLDWAQEFHNQEFIGILYKYTTSEEEVIPKDDLHLSGISVNFMGDE